ncbi:MAG TPA: O-antigen ligase family protein [Gammaproteobacteria bacterium]|nr:O-antigen ligase family protein [Gammaproteobacteria bacterium]
MKALSKVRRFAVDGLANREAIVGWVTVALVTWFGSYAYLYVFWLGGPKPLYSYGVLIAIATLYAAVGSYPYLPVRLSRPGGSGVGALLTWLWIYLIFELVEFFRSAQDPATLQALVTLGESVLLAAAFAILLAGRARVKLVAAALVALTVLAAAMNVFDFVAPTFSKIPGRGAGLYVNPNIAGHFLAMAMVGGTLVVPRRVRVLYLGLCGLGVLATFSRAGWILWGIGVLGLGWQGALTRTRRRYLLGVTFALLLGAGTAALLFSGTAGSLVSGTRLQNYLTPNTAQRLGIGSSVLSGYATGQRLRLIADSLTAAAAAPWLGHGIGYTTEWSYSHGPHNMYLLFLVDGGIVGLGLYLMLMAVLWRISTGVGRIMALQFIVAGMFTHNQMEQPVFLMLLAFICAHHDAVGRSLSFAPPERTALA